MIDVNAYLGHFAFRQLRHNTASGLLDLMPRSASALNMRAATPAWLRIPIPTTETLATP